MSEFVDLLSHNHYLACRIFLLGERQVFRHEYGGRVGKFLDTVIKTIQKLPSVEYGTQCIVLMTVSRNLLTRPPYSYEINWASKNSPPCRYYLELILLTVYATEISSS